ncbi:MAG: homoserine dehydrogenase [Bacteroidota bacterium]
MDNQNSKQQIGLFGFGVVGESLHHVITNSHASNAEVVKICIRDPNKKRSLPTEMFCTDREEIIQNKEINLVVELIDDAEQALEIVKDAMLAGKSVVSGNKKMLATHMDELMDLQQQSGCALLYDASACGSIPVIRNLEEYYDNDLLLSITGILNGSSNYILSRMYSKNIDFAQALNQAREMGFAEADPSLDVDGHDALYKIIILTMHGFGSMVNQDEIFCTGISHICPADIRFARERGYRIKLVAQAQKVHNNRVALFVMPKLVTREEYIYNVEDEYNGVVIEGEFYEKQFMFGKGAGGFPTGSSVLSDITARTHNYRYEYKKRNYFTPPAHTNEILMEVYYRYRFTEDLLLLDFEEITEHHSTREYFYVIGHIRLDKLLQVKDKFDAMKVFLAFIRILED